ncbi:MAG: rhodanese-like domain-containing protein [Phycisphaeraceae bacterium]|nr:rhodanese-like domain-containing protein [Phycisphaeraceae bacterium]
MKHLTRFLAMLGLALSVALVHSWVHGPLVVRTGDPKAGRPLPERPETAARDPSGDRPAQANDEPDQPDATVPRGTPGVTPGATVPRQFDVTTFGKFIDFDEAVFLHGFIDSGLVVFVDARSREDHYTAGHIAGAVRLSADMFDAGHPDVDMFMGSYPDDVRIVIYCSGGDCDESESTRARLMMRGYEVSHIYKNGWDEWSVRVGLEKIRVGIDP